MNSSGEISVPSVGLYMVQWNRRTTNAFTGENDVYIQTDLTSDYYGLAQIPVGSGLYISCSAIVPITSTPAKIWAGVYTANGDLVFDNGNGVFNRLTIYLMSSKGTVI